MRRRNLLVGALLAVGMAWVAVQLVENTYWAELSVPTTLQGEAAQDPLYAAKALVRELGGEVSAVSQFPAPPTTDVIVLTEWSWNLGEARRRQLEAWVEAGGRLVMDDSVWLQGTVLRAWSGISYDRLRDQPDAAAEPPGLPEEPCAPLLRMGAATFADEGASLAYLVCDVRQGTVLGARGNTLWSLRDEDGMRALRVAVGQGSVTTILATPFRWRTLLEADHAQLFVAMTQLRRGDRVHFLSETRYPSLLALTWQRGWPALLPAMLALALLLWRAGTRFGPLVPAPVPVRRSLVEQIRGTGRFLVRHGGGGALHAASRAALEAAARRKVPQFDGLPETARVQAIAAAAGLAPDSLSAALQAPAGPRSLVATLVLLESTRRRILSTKTRPIHGS